MRILCLFIAHLPVQVEAIDHGIPMGEPVIVGGLPHERKTVYDASPAAIRRGVKVGVPLRHAYSLCPEAHFLPADTEKYDLAFEKVLETMDDFSPVVERHGLGLTFLDAKGLGHYYNGEDNLARRLLDRIYADHRLAASISIADNKFVARVAATLTGPGNFTLVPSGEEGDFLFSLFIDILPCSEDMKKQIRLLGINTLGELTGLGPQPIRAQFGKEGVLAHQLASGIDKSPLVPRQKPARIEHAVSFDPPVNTLDGFLDGIRKAINSLSERLKERWQLCRRIELSFQFEGGTSREEALDLKVPTLSEKTLLSLIRLRLEQTRLESPVSAVTVSLSGLCENGRQLRLSGENVSRRRQIAPAVREIRGRLGKNMIKRPVLLQEEAFLPEQRFALRDMDMEL
jgi:nucleotidyltransferase/DNA polymerase involved in DNA repair